MATENDRVSGEGRTVSVVTGGNRGIGFATARALADLGHVVVIAARDLDAAQQAAAEITRQISGQNAATSEAARAVRLDVDDPESARLAAVEVGRWADRVDVLVNNAGILPEAVDARPHEFAGVDVFEQTFRTNVFGPVAVTEAFLPLLRRSQAGRIVNVSTTMGSLADQADPDSPYYSMIVPAYQSSKAALNSVTISLAKKLAGTAIKVTAVCPGFVQTDLTPANRDQAPITADQAVAPIVAAATSSAQAPSGTFVDAAGAVAW
jgi:NAD(P)-dependent dehydrogenase (short-subunit alcohol dehydrogenase family)